MLSSTGHRIKASRIYRFSTDQGSVLYDDGTRIWTINGSRAKHFEWEDLEGRNALVLRDDTRLYLPSLDHSAEPSYVFAYNPNATLLYVIAADRPRGHLSTGLCSSFGIELAEIQKYRDDLAEKGIVAHIALVDVFNWNVDEMRDGNRFQRCPCHTRASQPFFYTGYASTNLSAAQLARLPPPIWPAFEIVAQAIELDVDSKDRRRIQTFSTGLS